MIRCHLARMMGEHKMRIVDVARETGLSPFYIIDAAL